MMYRISLIVFAVFFSNFCQSGPVHKLENDELDSAPLDLEPETEITVIKNFTEADGKNTSKDLFVIKTIVYEIGILTDAGNDTIYDNETHEEIDVAFFDPENNGTFVDLSNIPIPIQTNVSGVSITGIVPANFGNLALLNDGSLVTNGSNFPIFPKKQIKVSHNISTYDKNRSNSILEGLPEILGLQDIWKHKNIDENDTTEADSKEKDSEEKSSLEKKLQNFDTDEIE